MRSSSPTLSNHKSINVSKKVRVHAYPDLIAAVPLASDEIGKPQFICYWLLFCNFALSVRLTARKCIDETLK